MYNIYCLQGYNNYYNRIVKKFNSIQEYQNFQQSVGKNLATFNGINFVPNDCVNTSQVLNWNNTWMPDYFITEDADTGEFSRWFVIESVRQRGMQYLFTLRRDLLVDYYDTILEAPCFVEKANLSYDDPLIFNKEDMTVNQIKQKPETLLMDDSECPWIIGYYSKGATLTGTVNINDNQDAISINTQDISDWEFYQYLKDPMIGPASYGAYRFVYRYGVISPGSASRPFRLAEVNQFNGNVETYSTIEAYQLSKVGVSADDIKAGFISYGLNNLDPTPYSGTVTQSKVSELLRFNGKLVRTLDGKYHKITVNSVQETKTINITAGDLFNRLKEITNNKIGMSGTPTANTFKYIFTSQYYTLTIVEERNLATKYNISTDRLITTDAPWDIFAIPYGEVTIKSNGSTLITTSKDYAISTAMSMQYNHEETIFDIQLLPYCPVQNLIKSSKVIDVTNSKEYSLITGPDDITLGIIFNIPKSTFDFDITKYIFQPAQSNIERKLNSECDKWRLASPNYSNYFDFSVEKNNGVQYFNVDCCYKPFSPYIHINPNFGNLYGYDDNSPRGLVLGGDFSLSQIIDQWQHYQIQNKNFQNIFDRQIQNMEINQRVQRQREIYGGVTGVLGGGIAGGITGAKSGAGIAGTIAGAVVGTATAATGAILNYNWNETLRNEVIDYQQDLFGYQLGNIQALPNTISKVSILNNNNKIFPVLEYYTATNTEKIAVLNKLAYNGMTVMAIGTLGDYIGREWSYIIYDEIKNTIFKITSKNYIKGRLIKIEDINCDDFHVANEIANEVFKGAFYETKI